MGVHALFADQQPLLGVVTASQEKKYRLLTVKDFDWALKNPVKSIFVKHANYVAEQWSPEYFTACKHNMRLTKRAFAFSWHALKQGDYAHGFKQLGHALGIGAVNVVNIQLVNFFKGVIGVLISAARCAVFGAVAVGSILGMVLVVVGFFSGFGGGDLMAQLWVLVGLAAWGFTGMFQDLANMIASLGHGIPAWLPPLILACTGVGILAIPFVSAGLELAKNMTGIFDLIGYGGTALILGSKAWFAKRVLKGNPEDPTALKTVAAWNHMKKELHPLKSFEGALLTGFAVNVIATGVGIALRMIPGVGPLVAKVVEWAPKGLGLITFLGCLYARYRLETKVITVDLGEELPSGYRLELRGEKNDGTTFWKDHEGIPLQTNWDGSYSMTISSKEKAAIKEWKLVLVDNEGKSHWMTGANRTKTLQDCELKKIDFENLTI